MPPKPPKPVGTEPNASAFSPPHEMPPLPLHKTTPLPPPEKPSLPPHKKYPLPLHEKHLLPHERAKKTRKGRIAKSVAIGTVVSIIAGLAMHLFQISINVILPVLAPIWIGVTTMAFMELKEP